MRVVKPFEIDSSVINSYDVQEVDYSLLEEGWSIIRSYSNLVTNIVNDYTNIHAYTNGDYLAIDGTNGKVYILEIGGTTSRQYAASELFEIGGVTWKSVAYNPNSDLIFLLSTTNRIWIFNNDDTQSYYDDFGVLACVDITAYADGVLSLNGTSGSIIRFISPVSGSVTFLDFSITTAGVSFTHITTDSNLLYVNTVSSDVKIYNLFEDQTSEVSSVSAWQNNVSISYDSVFNVFSSYDPSNFMVFNYLSGFPPNSFWRVGDICVYNGVKYVSNVDKNLDTPSFGATKDTPTWKKIGNSNQYNMFNDEQSSQTQRPDSLSITLNFDEDFDSIALFNIEGTNVSINHNGSGTNYNITGLNKLSIQDFAGVASSNLVITITNTGSIAKCGKLIVGQSFTIGESAYPITFRLKDFSRKETDDFGNVTIIKRRNSDVVEYTVAMDKENVPTVKDEIRKLTTIPCLYVDDNNEYPVVAYYEDMPIIVSTPSKNIVSLKVQELV